MINTINTIKKAISIVTVSTMLIFNSSPVFAADLKFTSEEDAQGEAYNWTCSDLELTLSGFNDPDSHIEVPESSTITLSDNTENTVGSIEGSGDLTIRAENSASLEVANTSDSSAYVSGNPGILATGDITIENITLEDNSRGNGISSIATANNTGNLTISNSDVTIKHSGYDRNYAILSSGDTTINNSNITVEDGYSQSGIFSFGDINATESNITVTPDGKYPIAATGTISLGENQKVTSGEASTKEDKSGMFTWEKPLSIVAAPASEIAAPSQTQEQSEESQVKTPILIVHLTESTPEEVIQTTLISSSNDSEESTYDKLLKIVIEELPEELKEEVKTNGLNEKADKKLVQYIEGAENKEIKDLYTAVYNRDETQIVRWFYNNLISQIIKALTHH